MVYDVLKVGKFKECQSLSKGYVVYNYLISYMLNAVEVLIYTQDVGEMAHIC